MVQHRKRSLRTQVEAWDDSAARARPLLLGHRGARSTARSGLSRKGSRIPPENSIGCFEYALSHGIDGFEFDVRVTRDRRLVICHNSWVGGSKVGASLYNSLCSRGGASCCLEEVLRAFSKRAYLDVEVKVAGEEEAIAAALQRYRPQCGFVISSFLPEVLRRLHQVDSTLPLGYVCDRRESLPLWRKLPIQLILPHYKLVTKELIGQAHDRGLQIFTWTVNDERDLLALAEWGIDGVISDDPGLLSQTFRAAEISGEEK